MTKSGPPIGRLIHDLVAGAPGRATWMRCVGQRLGEPPSSETRLSFPSMNTSSVRPSGENAGWKPSDFESGDHRIRQRACLWVAQISNPQLDAAVGVRRPERHRRAIRRDRRSRVREEALMGRADRHEPWPRGHPRGCARSDNRGDERGCGDCGHRPRKTSTREAPALRWERWPALPTPDPLAAHQRLEGEDHVAGRLKAFGGVLLQTVPYDAIEGRREIRARRRQLWRVLLQDRIERLDGRLTREGALSRDHLVEHDTQREEIGAPIDLLSSDLLRRHVASRSHDHARIRERGTCLRGVDLLR